MKYNIKDINEFYWSDRKLYKIVNRFIDPDDNDSMIIIKRKIDKVYKVLPEHLLNWWFTTDSFKELNK